MGTWVLILAFVIGLIVVVMVRWKRVLCYVRLVEVVRLKVNRVSDIVEKKKLLSVILA